MPNFIHQPVFDIPNFDRVTTDKLAHYFIVCQTAMYEIQRRHNNTTLTPLYEKVEREWNADPINNPKDFPPNPLTAEVVKKNATPSVTTHPLRTTHSSAFLLPTSCFAFLTIKLTRLRLIRVVFASNAGAQFIKGPLLAEQSHPSMFTISNNASAKLDEALKDHELVRAVMGGSDPHPTKIVSPGDVLRYMDANNTECCIRVKDHGSSAMRGEFFIVTTIIDEDEDLEGKCDREVKVEEMEQIVRQRIVSWRILHPLRP